MIFENVGTKKLRIVLNVCFIDTFNSAQTTKIHITFAWCLCFCPYKTSLYYRLPIEAGRQQNLPKKYRKCMKCNLSFVGDEFHFRFEWLAIIDYRSKLFPRIFLHQFSTYNFCRFMSRREEEEVEEDFSFVKICTGSKIYVKPRTTAI